jgi:SAM-dependent methyltransferase
MVGEARTLTPQPTEDISLPQPFQRDPEDWIRGGAEAAPARATHHTARSLEYYTGVRHDIVSMVPEDVRSVVEVGCAAGGTGKLLREIGVETLIGIDINPNLARLARQYYSQLIIGDAENLDTELISTESVDCILYPDVLEHFRDPWNALRSHLRFLKPGGCVIASIPNVRYYKTVQNLVLRGTWDYEEAGILDRGHLRFFTLKSVRALFLENGLEILSLQANTRGSHILKLANKLVFNRLHDFLVKQFRILARKN